MTQTTKRPKSQTLQRGLEILESVARTPLSIPEIADATGITYPTVHRIVSALAEGRYLKRADNRRYTLGPKVIELGFLAHQQVDIAKIAQPYLIDLARATMDTVHLARLEDREVVYLDKLVSRRPIEISSRIGGRKPVVSTGVGKALLLDEPEEEWRRLYRLDHHLMRIPVPEATWMKQMRAYRAGGYSYDLGEDEHQIRCVAAPLRDGSGRIVAAISVSSTLDYMPAERMSALIPVVTGTATAISRELGYADG